MPTTTHIEPPHVTVAMVIERNNTFLMVKEKKHGQLVYNQPAGHVDGNETLVEAAVRETLEESAHHCLCTAVLGQYQYTAPNGVTYHRTAFIADVVKHDPDAVLDSDIEEALWLSYQEILEFNRKGRLRSPIVLMAIDDYRAGKRYPLELICEPR